jgi:hypothetical protein
MIVNVYILMQPGADRPYVSTHPPSEEFQQAEPGMKLFVALVDLPGFDKVDGVVQATAVELPLSGKKKHV